MTLTKTLEPIKQDTRLVVQSPAVVSIKRLSASNPQYMQIGSTIGGVDIDIQTESASYGDDATTGAVGSLVINETASLSFTLSQAGIYNLAIAMNRNDADHIDITQPVMNPPQDGIVNMNFGGRRDMETYEIKVQSRIASGKRIREYIFFKAVPDVSFTHTYIDKFRTVVECRFNLLIDKTKPEDERLFSITDYYDSEQGNIQAPRY